MGCGTSKLDEASRPRPVNAAADAAGPTMTVPQPVPAATCVEPTKSQPDGKPGAGGKDLASLVDDDAKPAPSNTTAAPAVDPMVSSRRNGLSSSAVAVDLLDGAPVQQQQPKSWPPRPPAPQPVQAIEVKPCEAASAGTAAALANDGVQRAQSATETIASPDAIAEQDEEPQSPPQALPLAVTTAAVKSQVVHSEESIEAQLQRASDQALASTMLVDIDERTVWAGLAGSVLTRRDLVRTAQTCVSTELTPPAAGSQPVREAVGVRGFDAWTAGGRFWAVAEGVSPAAAVWGMPVGFEAIANRWVSGQSLCKLDEASSSTTHTPSSSASARLGYTSDLVSPGGGPGPSDVAGAPVPEDGMSQGRYPGRAAAARSLRAVEDVFDDDDEACVGRFHGAGPRRGGGGCGGEAGDGEEEANCERGDVGSLELDGSDEARPLCRVVHFCVSEALSAARRSFARQVCDPTCAVVAMPQSLCGWEDLRRVARSVAAGLGIPAGSVHVVPRAVAAVAAACDATSGKPCLVRVVNTMARDSDPKTPEPPLAATDGSARRTNPAKLPISSMRDSVTMRLASTNGIGVVAGMCAAEAAVVNGGFVLPAAASPAEDAASMAAALSPTPLVIAPVEPPTAEAAVVIRMAEFGWKAVGEGSGIVGEHALSLDGHSIAPDSPKRATRSGASGVSTSSGFGPAEVVDSAAASCWMGDVGTYTAPHDTGCSAFGGPELMRGSPASWPVPVLGSAAALVPAGGMQFAVARLLSRVEQLRSRLGKDLEVATSAMAAGDARDATAEAMALSIGVPSRRTSGRRADLAEARSAGAAAPYALATTTGVSLAVASSLLEAWEEESGGGLDEGGADPPTTTRGGEIAPSGPKGSDSSLAEEHAALRDLVEALAEGSRARREAVATLARQAGSATPDCASGRILPGLISWLRRRGVVTTRPSLQRAQQAMLRLCAPCNERVPAETARASGLPLHLQAAVGSLSLSARAPDDIPGAVACAALVCGPGVAIKACGGDGEEGGGFEEEDGSGPSGAALPAESFTGGSMATEGSMAPVTARDVVAAASSLWLDVESAAQNIAAVWAGLKPGHGDILTLRRMLGRSAADPPPGVCPSAVAAAVRAAVAAASRARSDDLIETFARGNGATIALAGSWLAHWQPGLLAATQIAHATGMPHAVASAQSVLVGTPAGCGGKMVSHTSHGQSCVTVADDSGMRESVLAGLVVLAAAVQQPSDLRRFLHKDAMASAPYSEEVVYHWDRLERRPSAWCHE